MQEPALLSLINDSPLKTDYKEFVARDGASLFFQTRGSGQPLLLIHGLGSSSIDWELQYADLAKHFELIMPDLRGHGKSTQAYFNMRKPSQSIAQFAHDVIDLMDYLEIKSSPIVGYSMGGAIAFEIARQQLFNPQQEFLADSLVIVNSLPSFEIDSLRKKYLIGIRKVMTKFLSMPRLAKILSKKLFPDDPVLSKKMVARNGRNKKPAYIASLKALLNWTIGESLADIPQETLFIAADNDYTPVTDKIAAADSMLNASVQVIENSMHGTPFDQTEKFNQCILNFLHK